MLPRVAVLGANGFIGGRLVEWLHLGGKAEVRPVVRRSASCARAARFDLDCRVADAFDERTLQAAFEGCDTILHAVAGDRRTITDTLKPSYHAAERAAARRFVYLSSAIVHGTNPSPGTDETTALSERQPLPYATAKVRAETILRTARASGRVELVILRPGIVVGPRSSWITTFVAALLEGRAYLVNGGEGICNAIYIDNLAHAIDLAINAPSATGDGEAFLVGDREQISWAELYRPIVEAFGMHMTDLLNVPARVTQPRVDDYFDVWRTSAPIQRLLRVLPSPVRAALGGACEGWRGAQQIAPSPWAALPAFQPAVTLETVMLHTCQYKLPWAKAAARFGYEPLVSFAEGSRRTIEWLAFAGYPHVTPPSTFGSGNEAQSPGFVPSRYGAI